MQVPTFAGMVRHECAEALGAIGSACGRAALTSHLKDAEVLVRESCEVALDVAEALDDFQYAAVAVPS